ncbi:MAG: DUF4397 domain-containing protein [Persicimonas sp.]
MQITVWPRLLLVWVAAVVLAGLALAGCGPEQVEYCQPGDPNCTSTDCPDGCPEGQSCSGGQCVEAGLQCASVGESCDPAAATKEGYLCVDWDGEGAQDAMCSPTCASDASCPDGSGCFVLRSGQDSPCDGPADCRTDMQCVQGTCRFTACQPSECAGFIDGQQECAQKYAEDPGFADGAHCYEFDEQGSYCLPAGRRELGQACVDVDTALDRQSFEQTCAEGLGCVAGTCQTPCEADADCGGADTCVIGGASQLGEGVGFCAEPCTPFDQDACGESQTCRPVTADTGHCVPAGQTQAFSSCTPGAGQCESGTLCVEYASAAAEPEARCQPICDLAAGAGSQAERDATCPQPPEPLASLRLVHMNAEIGPVDVYVRGESAPLVEGLGFEQAEPAADSDAAGWLEMPPGRHALSVLPEGAAPTDPSIVEVSVELGSGEGSAVYIAPPDPMSSDQAQTADVAAPGADAASSATDLRVVHLVPDAAALDVVAVADGADITDTSTHIVLAEGLEFGQAGALVGLPDAVGDDDLRVLAFAEGAARTDAQAAIFDFAGVSAQSDAEIVLRGTLDPDDYFDAGSFALMALAEASTDLAQGPTYTCTAIEGEAFGHCQQICEAGAADLGAGTCEGERMGCTPTEFPNREEWLTVCAPVGDDAVGAACDPTQPYGGCREGLYCLEYGAGAPASGGLRGRCTPLCETGDDSGTLGCESGQSCRPVSYGTGYETSDDIGRCGWACEPGPRFGDDSCPQGLQSCQPIASLTEDAAGQDAPVVEHEQPYCAPSGTREAGQSCRGRDCLPGNECLYPRSEQTDLTTTLLSPYFGSGASEPTCWPQCDPFDGDDAAVECDPGETCLFSYPLSAEVGHCAPVEEDVAPMQPCTKPGLSCGEDSICAIVQGDQLCMRFCDYLGADAQGSLYQSTCPADLVCMPFTNDVGYCDRPQ